MNLYLLATIVFFCNWFIPATVLAQNTVSSNLAFVGAKIYPSPTEPPILNGIVLVKNGKIKTVGENGKVKIPRGSQIIDCRGLTLTSGFWNSHIHFIEIKWENSATKPAAILSQQLSDMLNRYGFTTVFDTGSVWAETTALRARIEANEIKGPKILTVGEILSTKGALTRDFIKSIGYLPDGLYEIGSLEEGTQQTRQQVSKGADAIKIYIAANYLSPAEMPLETVKAIVSEAHKKKKLVLGHPFNSAGLQTAINGGVDVLLHTVPNAGELDQITIAKMKHNQIALIPTLKLMKVEEERYGADSKKIEQILKIATGQVRAYSQAGGQIIFGTDAGYVADYDPTEEYLLMERAGMNFRQILASLTTSPAKRFGVSNRTGKIARGMDADLVILNSDPATDIKAFANIRYTVRAGRVIYQSK